MGLLGFIRKNPENKFVLAIDWSKVDGHMAKVNSALEAKTRVNLDPDALRWSPVISSGSLYGSPFKKSAMDLDLDQSSPDKSSKKKRKKKKQLKNADDDSKDAHSTTTSSDTDEESDNTKVIYIKKIFFDFTNFFLNFYNTDSRKQYFDFKKYLLIFAF